MERNYPSPVWVHLRDTSELTRCLPEGNIVFMLFYTPKKKMKITQKENEDKLFYHSQESSTCLVGNSLGQQCLPSARWAIQDHLCKVNS